MLWPLLAAFLVGSSIGAVVISIFISGASAEREWEAYRRGYQLGVAEPRQ